jgi:excisionase family DNA binding protein
VLKEIFCKNKTISINGMRKRIKVAYTTGDTPEEVNRKLGLMPGAVSKWIDESKHNKGWRLEDELSFSLIVSLAHVLQVPIADLLTPACADVFCKQEKEYPSVTPSSAAAKEPPVTAQKTAEYMTPQQIAKDMGISAKTVIRYIQAGELPAVHLGRRYVIAINDVEKWLASRSTADRQKETMHNEEI